jgi:predicted helicase
MEKKMNTSLNILLNKYRQMSKTEREKGEYFELLTKSFLENDAVFKQQFSKVWTFSEWAKENELDGKDVGIDLVAKLKDEEGYCAIQCKFYAENYKLQKKDIDSFFTASGKAPFTRRLIVDTTKVEWSANAEDALVGQTIPCTKIGLKELHESSIDWSTYASGEKIEQQSKKTLRPHQQDALKGVEEGLVEADRGKLIMACGTGKTFTSLKIAEKLAGKGKRVLYLVPSLALMSQTVREWSNDAEVDLHSFAVCSDSQVGKKKAKDDMSDINAHDLAFPATTDASKLADKVSGGLLQDVDNNRMTVVFSTYQSIQTISDAQNKFDMPEFDLIICDEAHRTTGAKVDGEDESNFIKVHDQKHVKGKKRIYMTATPKIYSGNVKEKAQEADAVLCSMDNMDLYGHILYEINFSEAVDKELLTDYKVIVLALDEETVSSSLQNRLSDGDSELKLDDATKILGCYKALTKVDLKEDTLSDPYPMKRAVAFCKDIKSSKLIRDEFEQVVEEYNSYSDVNNENKLVCKTDHVDGTFNAKTRNEKIDWLNNVTEENTCHILSNARCLSEGVDVPALDAIMFLHPRKSQIDIVQSVGRVMRRAEGKKLGYVILPIGIPAGMTPEEALNNNEKYKVVWQILNALRSHDDKFDSEINRLDLGEDSTKIEVIAVSDNLPQRQEPKDQSAGIGEGGIDEDYEDNKPAFPEALARQTSFVFDDVTSAIKAKMVKKCGTREFWSDWAKDIADIAQKHIIRINTTLNAEGNTSERKAFEDFLKEIRDDLNDSITEEEAIEMLAQHLITKPVFDALFDDYSFTKNNPVSQAMEKVLYVLHEHSLEKESESLQKFYDSVRRRAEGITTAEAKQQIIVKLYDSFFRTAFKKLTEKLGIVYTPVEVVDFIIHSVNDVLQKEFGQNLGSKGVHIIDPFTGTGTFITRLLQSGLISKEELAYKYANEIHANELVLLAYYIAAINIENAYHDLSGGDYEPFKGICLTDTFQLYESEDMVSKLLVDNTHRRQKQKELDIRVIMGNPPYSIGQKSENDNSANIEYPTLDGSISKTYSKYSKATQQKGLYDSYIRAIRWGSDRLGESGVMAYVTNGGWLEANAMDGMRKCLAEEYSSLYVFHLRGNARTSGELRRKEKDNVFGQGTRTPVAITLFVKNPDAKEHGKIYFHDIGDYLTLKEKLDKIKILKSINGISAKDEWEEIVPDKFNDWLNQRDESFDTFIEIGNKKDKLGHSIFNNYSQGIVTSRDVWCYNSSKKSLENNSSSMIKFYNEELIRLNSFNKEDRIANINNSSFNISWSRALKNKLQKLETINFNNDNVYTSLYRPFSKQFVYYSNDINEMIYQMPKIFPTLNSNNTYISVTGNGSKGFSAIASNIITDFNMLSAGAQCFPLKLYEKVNGDSNDLFSSTENKDGYVEKDGVSDYGLKHFKDAYPSEDISKEDIFYYIYGLLHSEDYRARYADNLTKQLPRIPCVKKAEDFWNFSKAGRKLADLHINYETVEPYPVTFSNGLFMDDLKPEDYRVEKWKFGGKGKNKDKTAVVYNSKITMSNIPLEAYDYVVNGKPALEWVMERQVVKTDKASGIVNDANLYATETMGDPAYPLKLFQRVITVSLETMKIVNNLPKLEIRETE